MLGKIKKVWDDFWFVIIAGAIALAYLIGIKKGKDYEKIRKDKKTLANVSRANKVRDRIGNDPDAVRRLHKKYRR